MQLIRLLLAALLVAPAPGAVAAQGSDIVVRGDAARVEIERILNADNLDAGRLSARDIAETISAIERGRAPEDFWKAYQAHVRAWRRLAEAEDKVRRMMNDPTAFALLAGELAEAEAQIETTFDEVERIAIEHGARMPIPPVDLEQTV